jgi:hypothetical protein
MYHEQYGQQLCALLLTSGVTIWRELIYIISVLLKD